MTARHTDALRDACITRRTHLRLTQRELADRAGVSVDTIQAIERGSHATHRPGTKTALEDALDWTTGSIDALLAGGHETLADIVQTTHRSVIPDIDTATAPHADLAQVADWISDTAGDRALGDRWMVQVLQRRASDASSSDIERHEDRDMG